MDYLTTGEMAEINHVTKRTMWLYHDLGLLIPEKIDENTGYHYYSMRQCARLDLILYLKSIGLTLSQIKRILDNDDLAELLPILDQQIHQIEDEQKRLCRSLFNANLIRSRVSFLIQKPDLGKAKLEFLPARRIFEVDLQQSSSSPTYDPGMEAVHGWERLQHGFRLYLQEHQISLPVYYIGRIYSKEMLLKQDWNCTKVFTYVDETFDLAPVSEIPQGYYMTIVAEDLLNQDRNPCEMEYCTRMVDEVSRRGYRVTGDAFVEILSETRGNSVKIRMMVPVSVPAGTMVGV